MLGIIYNYLPHAKTQIREIKTTGELELLSLRQLLPETDQYFAQMLKELQNLGILKIADLEILGWVTLKTRFGLAAQTLEQLLNGKTNHTLEIPEATEILIRLALE